MSAALAKCLDDEKLLVLLRQGQLGNLREELQRRVQERPDNALALAQLALVALEMNTLDEAGDYIERALALKPQKPATVLALGNALLRQRRVEPVIALCDETLAIAPDDVELLNLKGRALNNAGRLLDARTAFERALQMQPGFAEAEHNLAHILRRMGDLDGAMKHFGKALAINPEYFSALYNLGIVQLSREQWAAAGENFRACLALEPQHPGALANLGQSLFRQEQFDEAESLLKEAIALAPGLIEALVTLALLYKSRGKLQASEDYFRRVYQPGQPEAYLASRLAEVLVEAGKRDEAAEVARQLLNAPAPRPEAADDWLHLAQVMRQAGHVDIAAGCYRLVSKLRPGGAREHMLLAGALVQSGEEQEALAAVDRSLHLLPGYQSALALKITVLRRLGRIEEADRLQDFDTFILKKDIAAPPGYPSVEAFNAALSQSVLSEPSLEFERTGHATRKGRHTDILDIKSEGPFRDLAELMNAACEAHMQALPWEAGHPFLGRRPKRWRLQMWSVVMDSQGHQIPHTHDDGYLSGVYYPLLPETVGSEGTGEAGWIEFGRPMQELAEGGESNTRRIAPKAGRLVIFPSYFVHNTVPFESDQPRISIAFDLVPLEWVTGRGSGSSSHKPASEASKLAFLAKFKTEEIEHSEHDLLSHLTGVRDVLAGWDESPALCDAGLFHSVYGTESFSSGAIPVNLRERVRDQIGEQAERLAWLFGAMRKGSFYANLERDPPFRIQSRLDDQWLEISTREFEDLVRLTVANWFEQLPRVSDKEREQVRGLFLKMRPWLNAAALRQFDEVYAPAT